MSFTRHVSVSGDSGVETLSSGRLAADAPQIVRTPAASTINTPRMAYPHMQCARQIR